MTIPQAFALALQHHQSGRVAEAENIYREILAVEPQHADALHLLGVLAHQAGRNDLAVELISQALALKPNYPEACCNLGTALKARGQLDAAIAALRQAITLNSAFPEAHANLGNALREMGHLDEAIDCLRRSIALRPHDPEACHDLGVALFESGRLDEAIAAGRQALACKPDYPEVLSNLGNALLTVGKLDESIAACRQAIALRPNFPEALNNLGNALRAIGLIEEACAACRQAIALQPTLPEAHNNLGNALYHWGVLDEAVAAYRQAIALKPCYPTAFSNLGTALLSVGQLDQAITAYRHAIDLQPNFADAHSNLVYTLRFHPGFDEQTITEEHQRWNQQHAEPLRRFIQPHANEPDPNRRLRIGYISADFWTHSVAFFLEDLLAGHDPAQVEVFCYSSVDRPDAVTARLRQSVPHWREIFGLPDAQVAELIRRDGIDLLVDLAGHTAHHRLLVFARKPAPVQVTWLGYPGSTGLAAMDYRLTDALADPPGTTEELHTEQLIRLPDCAWCYRPSALAPAVSDPPVAHTGHLTFGCFNALRKITPAMRELWSRILLAAPGSRLLLKSQSLRDAATRTRLQQEFEQLGIGADRLELVGYAATLGEHLATYGRVDIALDTFPYHGTTTTCEALWMGVPVVTLAGKTHASRVGVSLLHTLGLSDWIAASPEEYLRLALQHGVAVERLAALRRGLRARMMASPLMDGPRFARHVEQAFRQMWQAWCAQPSTERA